MANASKNNMGSGALGKHAGTGAMTDESIVDGRLTENMVLSNRDKSRHSGERGLDGKMVQTEQFQDHSANHLSGGPSGGRGNSSAVTSDPMSNQSGAQGSLKSKER
ncbi:hypothetical protein SLNSH_23520 [Alsobacter soli]|uniref:Uncharacterized protein n=1 Tax=Alsobacter soli TaxID=2109933 RepID=A0A2T1HLM0_9HYPH|nr:hypothetical protein [Alsobacter soli]PSC02544.1 hypothetical protein SLNSH_23520 [Alsobacter soli]